MRLVHWLYLLPLGVWLGMLLAFAAFFAPALFSVLPGPEQAGSVVRAVLPKLEGVGLSVAALAFGVAFVHGGRDGRHQLVRLIALGVVFFVCAVSAFVVTRKMEALRQEAGGVVSTLPREHPVRQQFGQLHGVSSTLMLVGFLSALTAFALPPRPE